MRYLLFDEEIHKYDIALMHVHNRVMLESSCSHHKHRAVEARQEPVLLQLGMYLVEYPEPICIPGLHDGDETVVDIGLDFQISQHTLSIWVSRTHEFCRE